MALPALTVDTHILATRNLRLSVVRFVRARKTLALKVVDMIGFLRRDFRDDCWNAEVAVKINKSLTVSLLGKSCFVIISRRVVLSLARSWRPLPASSCCFEQQQQLHLLHADEHYFQHRKSRLSGGWRLRNHHKLVNPGGLPESQIFGPRAE